ncbi:MAG: AbrB/MazE/SpoVT family DNA-binding domain-containing protein [Deltaproteobacteria bacterium]|nr:AbrB/MazE/SpoVT family DNA-binding domain-containing protein [Deltaproteobacteria bacterium]
MPAVPVSAKGQILVPKRIREKFGIRPGGRVLIIEESSGILLKPAPEDPIEAACGFLKGDFSLTRDLTEEHLKEQEHETTRRAR